MQKNWVIALGAGLLVILLLAGLWLFYFSGRTDEPLPEPVMPDPAPETVLPPRALPFEHFQEEEPEKLPAADPEEDEQPADEFSTAIIGDGFINTLAEMIFDNYFPPRAPGEPSSFTLSFNRLNMHFATDLSDFHVDDQDILKARQEVMGHLLQPAALQLAAEYFGPRLVERIVYLAGNREKPVPVDQGMVERLLTPSETADLLRVFSIRVSYLAHVFEKSAADEKVIELAGLYLEAVDDLRDVYFEYWQLDDSQVQETERLGREIKALIEKREVFRDKMLSRVATAEMLRAGHDYLYEIQWVYRRVEIDGYSRNSIRALAEAGRALSLMALERAEAVLEDSAGD